jgi:hypothetical protein
MLRRHRRLYVFHAAFPKITTYFTIFTVIDPGEQARVSPLSGLERGLYLAVSGSKQVLTANYSVLPPAYPRPGPSFYPVFHLFAGNVNFQGTVFVVVLDSERVFST